MWSSSSSIDGRTVKKSSRTVTGTLGRDGSDDNGRRRIEISTVIGAAPVRVAQDFVGLVGLTEAFGIRTFANIGMHVEGDAAICLFDLARRRSS
jgi:hypothetical protein